MNKIVEAALPSELHHVLKTLPVGAVPTWDNLWELCEARTDPIYFVIVNQVGDTHMLQLKNPKAHVQCLHDGLLYSPTKERLAQVKFFNRDFVPTFFIFDNYMHYYAFKMKLKGIGYAVNEQKFA